MNEWSESWIRCVTSDNTHSIDDVMKNKSPKATKMFYLIEGVEVPLSQLLMHHPRLEGK